MGISRLLNVTGNKFMKEPKIYLKTDKEFKNINEVIYALYNHNYHFAYETYSNKECTDLQCSEGKLRSFDDIYYLCKTYFPDTTEKDVIYELVNLKINNKVCWFAYCGGMGRIKIQFYLPGRLIIAFGVNRIYNNISNTSSTISGYNWKKLFKLIGINNSEEFKEYTKELYK